MTALELSATQAWTTGARMWIAPAPANSLWSRKLDWYLNFRISKGLTHQPKKRSDQLEGLLNKIEWKLSAGMTVDDKPLLIAAGLWLPCDWLLVLENFTHEKAKLPANLEMIATAWSDLGEPKLRVFGPSQLTKEVLSSHWNKSTGATGAQNALPKEFDFVHEQ